MSSRKIFSENRIEDTNDAEFSSEVWERIVAEQYPVAFSHWIRVADYRVLRCFLDRALMRIFDCDFGLWTDSTRLSPSVKRSIVPTGLSAGTSATSALLRLAFFSTFAATP